jgi:hypothetical protein
VSPLAQLADEEGATLVQNPLLATARLVRATALSALLVHSSSLAAHATVAMDWIPVGNPGNPGNTPDTATSCLGGTGCGSVLAQLAKALSDTPEKRKVRVFDLSRTHSKSRAELGLGQLALPRPTDTQRVRERE